MVFSEGPYPLPTVHQSEILNPLESRPGQDCVSTAGCYTQCPTIFQGCCSICQRTRRVNQVIYNQYVFPFHFTDDVHYLGNVLLGSAFVDKRQTCAQLL